MTPERWAQVKQVLAAAVALTGPDRASYLESACAGDPELRAEVESLLASNDDAGAAFLETPIAVFRAPVAHVDEPVLARVGQRLGAYDIVGELGHGGMSDVFAAVRSDGQYEKRVALKLVRAGYATAGILDRFRAERQILASLDHPNIGRLLDGGTTNDGVPYLVMELVDGVPIDVFCDQHALPVRQRLELFVQVCAAVQYAHQHLVVHRDIKPGNVLVTADGVPKLLDFGIAKLLDPVGHVEETALRPFTPEYASPEQVRGEPVSTASDVYALGVLLYRLLTGRSPYRVETRTPAALADAITSQDPARLEGSLRGDLDVVLRKALRKEPEQRYGSAEQFAGDIRRHLEGRPVLARKGTWSYRSAKFARRHAAVVTAAALVFVSLVTGIVVTQREARIAEANRRRADARFNDVRKLANSLIFEVHDSIQNLPGATDARKLILQRALEYLDSLAKEATNEPDLQRELVAGYGRIAQLQGDPYTMQLGDANGARSSYQKAVAISEGLAGAHPLNRRDQIQLGQVYFEYGEFLSGVGGDRGQGVAYVRRALAILERQLAATPDDLPILQLTANAMSTLAMMLEGNGLMAAEGNATESIEYIQRALELTARGIERFPSNTALVYRRGTLELVMGESLLKLDDRPASLTHYQNAIEVLEPLARTERNMSAAYNTAVAYGKVGDVLLIDGQVKQAIRFYAAAQQAWTRLADANPHDQSVQQQLCIGLVEVGYALMQDHRMDEGMRYMRDAVARMETDSTDTPLARSVHGLIRSWYGEALERQGKVREAAREYATVKERLGAVRNPDPRLQGFYAAATDRLAATYGKLGDEERATREYEESRKLLEPLVQAHPRSYELVYVLAETYTAEGDIAAARAEHARARAEKVADWETGCSWYEKSLTTWGAVPHPTWISTSGFEVTVPAEVSRRRARCERAIKALAQ